RFAMGREGGLDALAGSKLPKLERMSVWLGGTSNVTVDDVYPPDEWTEENDGESRYPHSFSAHDPEHMDDYRIQPSAASESMRALLDGKFAKLTHLGFPSSSLRTDVVEALLASKLLAQVKTLDLSHCSFGDDAGKALAGAKKQLAHLESIDLSECKMP